MALEFFTKAMEVAKELEATQGENISEAAKLIADAIEKGGILQAFGSGHSYAAALEICGRAGGFIPSKVIADPAGGIYESVEGVGKILAHRVQIKEHDVVVLISNSGRNPLAIELAQWVKAHGNKLIVVTALDISKASSSRHSSGTLLYQYADVILDNMSIHGDAALSVEGLETKVCGTSSFAGVLLLQQTIFEAVQILVENGVKPPVYVSSNIDGGLEYNTKKEVEYSDRIFHM